MLLTCKCLNVSIMIKGSDIQPVDFEKLGFSNDVLQDSFFKEKVGVVELGEINKEQSCLVHIRHAGDWLVHRCLNCDMHTHAIHPERRGDCVIINQNLLADAEKIAALKSSDAFSEVFRIITDRNEDVMSSDMSMNKVTGPLQAGVLALQQQLAEAMRNQTVQVEEKVRAFSEQQYAELEGFRKTAHEDQRALVRLLQRCSEAMREEGHPPPSPARPTAPSARVETPLSPALSTLRPASLARPGPPAKAKKSQPTSVPGSQFPMQERVRSGRVVAERVRHNRPLGAQVSLDTEGLFDLEGMEEAAQDPEHFQSEDENEDTDESGSHDEGIHIPRQRTMSQLAKSLPVNVPAFHLANSAGSINFEQQDPELKEYPHERMDIAASIKALAQSVHGGASVFGDLPRPRFSTQL